MAFREWLRREERAGRFPLRMRYSERYCLWDRAEVERWLANVRRGPGTRGKAQAA